MLLIDSWAMKLSQATRATFYRALMCPDTLDAAEAQRYVCSFESLNLNNEVQLELYLVMHAEILGTVGEFRPHAIAQADARS